MTITTSKTGFIKIIVYALAASAVATAANVILYFISKSAGFLPDNALIPNQSKPITLLPVIFSSIVPSIIAGLVMAITHRFAKNSKKIFNTIAVSLLIMSFANPFFIPGVPMMMAIMLNLMHVTVAGSLIYTFNKYII